MSLRQPLRITSGRDALLTCVADNLGNYTLMWKKVLEHDGEKSMEILTAGDYRVTKDSRVVVLHDSGESGAEGVEEVVEHWNSVFIGYVCMLWTDSFTNTAC